MDQLPLDQLPLVVYEVLFDHLHLIDLARLRQVCKRLCSVVEEYRIRELVISRGDLSVDTFTFADSGTYQSSCIHRPKNLKRTMPYQIHKNSSRNSLFNPTHFYGRSRPIFSAYELFLRSPQFNVRFLKSLTFTDSDPRFLNEVNKLLQLERLKIEFESLKPSNCKLSLPNLRTLLLNCDHDRYAFTVEVEAPRCEGFHLKSGRHQNLRVQFGHSHSVKQLSLHEYHESSHIFKNIEFLQIAEEALIDKRTFAAFPRLQALKILKHSSLDALKELFELCRQRNVRLTFHGIQLDDCRDLNAFAERDFETNDLLYGPNYGTWNRLIDRYGRLEDDLNFVTKIEFSERAAPVVYRLLEADASRFLRKFPNLIDVRSAIRIERPELFLRLLTGCYCLQRLHIQNSDLPQQWFEQLTNIRTLMSLKVKEETKVDLSLAFKFPILYGLITNHHVDLKQEIKLDVLEYFQLYLELDEIKLSFWKSPDSLHDGVGYNYTLFKTKRRPDHSFPEVKSRDIEHLPSFEHLARRYEEIRNELDNSSRTARAQERQARDETVKETVDDT